MTDKAPCAPIPPLCSPSEEDEELELYDALRVSLVRHEHGQPLALGFTFDLDERQQDFLLAPTTQAGLTSML